MSGKFLDASAACTLLMSCYGLANIIQTRN